MAEQDTTVKSKSWVYIVIALIVIVLVVIVIINKQKVNDQGINLPIAEESSTGIVVDGKSCEPANTIQCSDDASKPCMCTEEKIWQCLAPCASGQTCNKSHDGLPTCNDGVI